MAVQNHSNNLFKKLFQYIFQHELIVPGDFLKVLGIKFEPNLGWDVYIRYTTVKIKFVLKKVTLYFKICRPKRHVKNCHS